MPAPPVIKLTPFGAVGGVCSGLTDLRSAFDFTKSPLLRPDVLRELSARTDFSRAALRAELRASYSSANMGSLPLAGIPDSPLHLISFDQPRPAISSNLRARVTVSTKLPPLLQRLDA